MPSPLSLELHHHEYLREQLVKQFPEETEETLADTLEGETNLHEMLARVLRSAMDDRAIADGLGRRICDMETRKQRIVDRANKKRALVLEIMERAGIKKLADPEFTATLRAAPAPVIITDEVLIPFEFWRQGDPVLKRKELRQALAAKRIVPGAVLGNAPMTISVRTK